VGAVAALVEMAEDADVKNTPRQGWGRIGALGRRREAGSAAIVGIAIIVLVGFIGNWLVSSARMASATQANASMAAQTYYIAEAGAEWACKHGTATSSPLSFGSGQFEIVENADAWDSVATVGDTTCTIECTVSPNPPSTATGDGGIEYVLRSREYTSSTVEFRIMNTSNNSIKFDGLKVTWSSPTAYFERVTARIFNGTNYGNVWRYNDENPRWRWGSGDQYTFTRGSGVTLPPHYTAELNFVNFRRNKTGGRGSRDMRNTEFEIQFYLDDAEVGDITVERPPT